MVKDAMYDRFAEEYAAHAAEGSYNALYDRPAVLELAGPLAGRTVLVAGCGPSPNRSTGWRTPVSIWWSWR